MDHQLTNQINISDYFHRLSKELDIQGTIGVLGNELELIALIRNCPFLYDRNYADFKNIRKKNEAWEAISKIMNVSVGEVQSRWKAMRESFNKYNDRLRIDPKTATTCSYYDEMKFLLPFISKRKFFPCSSRNNVSSPKSSEQLIKEESYESGSTETDSTVSFAKEAKVEDFISSIKQRPILYDRKNVEFKNHDLKLKTWKLIAKEFHLPVSECIARWKNLRDRYAKERKLNKTDERKWELFDKLTFLDQHILTRKRYSYTHVPSIERATNSQSLFSMITSSVNSTSDNIVMDSSTGTNCVSSMPKIHEVSEMREVTVEFVDANAGRSPPHFLKEIDDSNMSMNVSSNTHLISNVKDEDELFGQTIAAELRGITSSRKKMKLKSDIYKLLYEQLD